MHRITVRSQSDLSRAEQIRDLLRDRFPRNAPAQISLTRSYIVDAPLTKRELKLSAGVLTNPVMEEGAADRILLSEKLFSCALEIGFLPGVTDNVATTVRQMLEDALGRKFGPGEQVYSSLFVFLHGKVSSEVAERMAHELYNPLIERARVIPSREFSKDVPIEAPRVALGGIVAMGTVDLAVPDEELARIGKEGIENEDGSRRGPLALSLGELKAIRSYFKRQGRMPTDIELESLAQTWSEHCKHTIFADPLDEIKDGIYRHYIRRATRDIRKAKGKRDFCVSVFTDNSGGIAFNDEYLVTHKVETHNSPSALDPFGGAMTGIVGVNRDALGFGVGAKPIANVYGFCVGNPSEKRRLYRDAARQQELLAPARILEGVVRGIEGGGNQSGIPTPLGFVYTDDSYRGKPLVFAGTVGLLPRRSRGRNLWEKRARPGDLVVMLGGRVGLDGIHGATFSSEAFSSGSPSTAVQIGDPITQKKLSDALIREIRDKNLYTSLTDNGAGGLSCSVAEMAKECGGCEVDLAKVPLKYPGLAPWQIWISESQERMTLAVPREKWLELARILKKHGVEGTRIGTFTRSGACVVRYGKKKVMDLELDFLHDGRPATQLRSKKPARRVRPLPRARMDTRKALLALLASPNIGSYAFISEQYDHEVQGLSVTKPLIGRGRVNADAAVLRPLPHEQRGLVLAQGYAPSYSALDPYRMAAAAIDTSIRNALAAGASPDHLAILDNFCWSSSNDPERLWELKEAARACYDVAVAYGTPFISGKDSMFNDFRGYDAQGEPAHIAALPTLLISSVGVMEDARTALTFDLKQEGDLVYLLGETRPEFGGSEYARILTGDLDRGTVPVVDVKKNMRRYRAFAAASNARLMSAAIAISRGGLAVAASKMALAGQLGMDLTLPGNVDETLFSESQGRFLVTVPAEKAAEFERTLKGGARTRIGTVTSTPKLVLRAPRKPAVSVSLRDLARAYHAPYLNF